MLPHDSGWGKVKTQTRWEEVFKKAGGEEECLGSFKSGKKNEAQGRENQRGNYIDQSVSPTAPKICFL